MKITYKTSRTGLYFQPKILLGGGGGGGGDNLRLRNKKANLIQFYPPSDALN